MEKYLLNENFMDFEIGELPYDKSHSATGEYHYVINEGYAGKWVDPVCNYTYNGSGASWIVTEDEGKHFMEQMRVKTDKPHITHPMLMSGDINWFNYVVTSKIRMFKTSGIAGIGFCVHNSMNLLALVFADGEVRLEHRHKMKKEIFASKPYTYNCDDFYELKAECNENVVKCFVNNEFVFEISNDRVAEGGKVCLTATDPTQFENITVTADQKTIDAIKEKVKDKEEYLTELRDQYPNMKLYKKIDLKNFGAGRQLRFGHLCGGDKWYGVIAQSQKRVHRDAYGHISCLTAFDLDGNILWQIGEPSTKYDEGQISADMPLQVYDIDGDGIDEVITSRNFEILILDGRTGKVKKKAKMPFSDDDDSTLIGVPNDIYAFDRINADGIRIANFTGKERPTDILVKDRYCRIYALNSDLELMWKFKSETNTGHFPYAFDINNDGHDELLCGYNLLDHKGNIIWKLPITEDHTDEIISGKFMAGSNEGHIACVSGSEGFYIADYNGNIVMKDDIGHAQRVSTGNYCPKKEGFELCVTNYWGHQGIVYFYDSKGNPLWELENELNGNVITPVNWKGDGSDLILLNPDIKRGGLINGNGDMCVAFPDDGHPEMCAEAIDLTGDARDEIVVWDYHTMYIYTQDDGYMEDAYKPVKYPHYNASNYRGEYSYPSKDYLV
ncbi:hypothetical protein QA612_13145 [Evansella sp. AB-P1]|uniref:hypothetical protein n=1 Tax=Evansella sp. AB-P1 TaxID=3037653 RepID=UPI00241EFBEE|nr:hypothetical protein [Evansella sp. AB-P1]MDG5788429.1 hypothetical protein [Evansella sp. AB-P1]